MCYATATLNLIRFGVSLVVAVVRVDLRSVAPRRAEGIFLFSVIQVRLERIRKVCRHWLNPS